MTRRSRRPSLVRPQQTAAIEPLEGRRLFAAALVGLTGEYFQGTAFDTPVVVRTDRTVRFDWFNGRPDQDIAKGGFSARWTGQVTPATSGTYTFAVPTAGAAKLWVGGTLLIDTAAGTSSATATLTAGQPVDVRLDYVSPTKGDALVRLIWWAPKAGPQAIPGRFLTPDATVALPDTDGHLLGTYFLGANFNQQVMQRADPALRFDWHTGVPDTVIPHATPFSVRWTGDVTPGQTESYTFHTRSDDGIRLWVDDQLLVNDWHVQSATGKLATMTLQAGQTYAIRVEYYQNGYGHTSASLRWSSADTALQPVPFGTASGVVAGAPLDLTGTAVTPTDVNLSWDAVTPTDGYLVQRSDDDGATWHNLGTTPVGTTTFADLTAMASSQYQYRVGSQSPDGSARLSLPVTVVTSLGSPTNVAATATGTTGVVTWDAVPGAAGYTVQRSPAGAGTWATVGTTTGATAYTDPTLAAGTAYDYRVLATAGADVSAPSNVATVLTVPAAPTITSHTVDADNVVHLGWTDVTGETGFAVQASADGSTGWTTVQTTPAGVTSAAVAGQPAGTTEHYRVVASDAAGSGPPSAAVAVTTGPVAPAYTASDVLYGLTTGTAKVYAIDQSTGAATQIGSLAFGTSAAGRDPVSGDFYYVSTDYNSVKIATWDPHTGVNTTINPSVAVTGDVLQVAFRDDGTMWMTDMVGDVFQVDRTTGAATPKGALKVGSTLLGTGNGDMAFAPDGTLFIELNSTIYTVDPAALASGTSASSAIEATQVGPTGTGGNNLQIAFGRGGTLFGYGGTTSGDTTVDGQLYAIDTATGTATAVHGATPSGVAMGDLASVPVYADLSVTQSAAGLARGSNGTITLAVANAGPDATNRTITVTETLAAGLSFVGATGDGWSFAASGQTVIATYANPVAAGASPPALVLTVAVGSGTAASVTTTATVTTPLFDSSPTNNTSVLTSPVT